jgi:hypothetical protein
MKHNIEDVLKAVREHDAELKAPDYLETRLRAAFREQHSLRPRRVFAWWRAGAAACAMAVFALLMWRVASLPEVAAPVRPVVAKVAPEPAQPKPVMTAAAPPVERSRPKRAKAEPTTVEFTALPYAPPLMPYEQGQVIRVRLPRQSLRDFGVSLRADRPMDRIPAEILMGEDGVARGIRFASYR